MIPNSKESLECCILPNPSADSLILGSHFSIAILSSFLKHRNSSDSHPTFKNCRGSTLLSKNKMSGRVSHFLSWLLLATLHLEGTNGFQTNQRPSISVISRSRLSVATNDSISTTAETISGNGVDYKAYGNGYKTVFTELPYGSCEPSVGSIPSDLKGSYFRAGPAMFSAGSIAPPKTSIIQPRDGPPIP